MSERYDVTQRVNEFTGLTSYFCGDAAMTAAHNHVPHGGNWRYVVGIRGEKMRDFVGDSAFSDAMNYLTEIGNANEQPEPVITSQQLADMAWDALVRLTLEDVAELERTAAAQTATEEAA